MKKLLLAAVAVVVLAAGPAVAADLGRKAPAYIPPPAPPPPTFTGCYVDGGALAAATRSGWRDSLVGSCRLVSSGAPNTDSRALTAPTCPSLRLRVCRQPSPKTCTLMSRRSPPRWSGSSTGGDTSLTAEFAL